MDRRGFFKSLALMAGAVSVSPTIFIPKFEPVKWKRAAQFTHSWAINPEWVNAPFEPRLYFGEWTFTFKEMGQPVNPACSFPMRYKFENGVYVEVPPFIDA